MNTWTRARKRAWDCGWDSFERGFTEEHRPDYQTHEECTAWERGWRDRRDNDFIFTSEHGNKPKPNKPGLSLH